LGVYKIFCYLDTFSWLMQEYFGSRTIYMLVGYNLKENFLSVGSIIL